MAASQQLAPLGSVADRRIRTRLAYFDRRLVELKAQGMDDKIARAQAYGEACRLRFDRRGNLKGAA